MKTNKFALQILVSSFIVISFIACDKDFVTLESDIINDDVAANFDILSLKETNPEFTDVITYTKPLGPVQTNGLALGTLGIYDDAYGRVSSSFVVQPALSSFDPNFTEDIEEIEIDSVVLTIPYSFTITEIDEDGNITYDIDSVIGREPLKISLYESNYFIRDFNPESEFDESQAYFSNKTALITEDNIETISDMALESQEIEIVANPLEVDHLSIDNQGNLTINEDGYILLGPEPEDEEEERVVTRQPPGIRLKLEPNYWMTKIINQQDQSVLSSANTFSEYFRGLYFKAEANDNDDGSFLIFNIGNTNSNITIYYTRPSTSTIEGASERESATFAINFNGNSITFIDNNLTTPINEGDSDNGDSRIYLKGGQGSIARVKLFNGDGINDGDDSTFDDLKNFFVETNDDGEFVRSKRLVNEANLVFYVDQNAVDGGEPDRIYLYDIDNKTPLVDYFLDANSNLVPSLSIINHLGPLQRVDDESDGDGIKYKLKITEHINNLLIRDSTNVELGLTVSLNINLEEGISQRQVQSSEESDITAPISSVLTPRGTVLHGNNTEDESKRVYLEIYYTEPNN